MPQAATVLAKSHFMFADVTCRSDIWVSHSRRGGAAGERISRCYQPRFNDNHISIAFDEKSS